MMKRKFIPVVLILLLAVFFIAQNDVEQVPGPHGGIVKQAENSDYKIEMKNTYGNFYTYLLNKKLKPLSNKDVTCTVKFFFPDNIVTDAQLLPYGEEGFTSETAPKYFNFCKIIFHVLGEDVTAKFDNQTLFVQNDAK